MIFIVEDKEVAKKIIIEYFEKNKVTYANTLPYEKREELVKLIETLE